MRPVLFDLGSFHVYSYGVMLAIAYIFGGIILRSELKKRQMDSGLSDSLVIAALLGGLLGGKLYYIIEHFDSFIKEPVSIIFSGGLTWYGGFIGALIAVYYVVYRKKLNGLQILDSMSAPLAIGYAIGRIGCLLSGDGDYGKLTNLPWAMSFPNGTVPTTELVHPTPIYETLIMFTVFLVLRRLNPKKIGLAFGAYLVFASLERFFIEFLRINPVIFIGLTTAQIVSLLMLPVGIFLIYRSYFSNMERNEK